MVRLGSLMNAAIVEPSATVLIELLHMLQVPRRQERKQRREVHGFIVLYLVEGRVEFCQQLEVRDAMVSKSRKALPLQQLFFTLKVHLGEANQPLKLQADTAAVKSPDEHCMQLIQRIHQDPVLIVDGLNADDALVTPRQQGHIFLHDQVRV